MILLDADVLLIDLRYPRDPRFAINQKALVEIQNQGITLGVTAHALLEVVGILSFNRPTAAIPTLPDLIRFQYRLDVVPDFVLVPAYAGCSVAEVMQKIGMKMSLSDAEQAVQIGIFAPSAQCLLTWNARHFAGKVAIPVLTPEEWLNQNVSVTP